jgi:hypothetical protein
MIKKAALLGVCTLLAISGIVRIELVAGQPAKGEPDEPSVRRGVDYLVFPVKTELQRLLVHRQDAKVFVALNGTGLRSEDDVDETVLKAIRADLGRIASKGDAVQFSIFFGKSSGGFNPRAMREALRNLALDLGLEALAREVEWRNDVVTWKDRLATIEEGLPDMPGAEEAGIGDSAAKTYPVRTRLSRYLTQGADCVVDILKPLAGDGDEETCEVIRSSVSKLAILRKMHISFRVHSPPDGNGARDQIMGELKRLAESLGFNVDSVTL